MIGIANAFNEIIPGHIHLRPGPGGQAGRCGSRGYPVEFPVIGICDGIAMNHDGMKYPLASRELIADSIETMAVAHKFDGLVLVGNCDKIVPGMMMAACRLNIPSVYVGGGPMLTGTYAGQKTDLVRGLFEAVGQYAVGEISEAELRKWNSAPLCGSCAGLSPPTPWCLAALGIGPPAAPSGSLRTTQGSGQLAGRQAVEMVKKQHPAGIF